LRPLLVNPISRAQVVAGKWMACLSLTPWKATLATSLVPVLGQTLLRAEVLRGEWPTPLAMLVTSAVAMAAALLCLLAATRLLAKEHIIFTS